MADQLAFEWPTGVALGPEDFFVSAANAQAFAMVSAPDSWPERKLTITGPQGCGKSHLARVFAESAGAAILQASALGADSRCDAPAVVIEDMTHLPQQAEEAVFHLHNHLRSTGGYLLFTATQPPSRWPIALPDLASRVQATTTVQIDDPDDALLSALLMKLFADRQILPRPDLIAYLSARIERSYAAASAIVAALDSAALQQGQKINRALARQLLDKDH